MASAVASSVRPLFTRLVRPRWSWLLVAGVLGACGDDSRPRWLGAGGNQTEDIWCRALCALYDRCEGNVGSACELSCLESDHAYFLRSSTAALEFETSCMNDTTTCSGDFEGALDTCFQASIGALDPTEESWAVCDAMAVPFFECRWFSSPSSCAAFHAGYSSGALAAWQEGCSDVACTDIEACMDTTLFSYGE